MYSLNHSFSLGFVLVDSDPTSYRRRLDYSSPTLYRSRHGRRRQSVSASSAVPTFDSLKLTHRRRTVFLIHLPRAASPLCRFPTLYSLPSVTPPDQILDISRLPAAIDRIFIQRTSNCTPATHGTSHKTQRRSVLVRVADDLNWLFVSVVLYAYVCRRRCSVVQFTKLVLNFRCVAHSGEVEPCIAV